MNDLHKGYRRDSGMAWSVLIDVSAILMTVSSITDAAADLPETHPFLRIHDGDRRHGGSDRRLPVAGSLSRPRAFAPPLLCHVGQRLKSEMTCPVSDVIKSALVAAVICSHLR